MFERFMSPDQRGQSGGWVSAPIWLTVMTLAVLIPFIAFTAYSINQLNINQRQSDERRIIERVDSLSASVDRDIRGIQALAEALAASSYLVNGDMRGFYNYAKLTLPSDTTHVILLDTSLQQLLNTRVPFGTALPKTAAVEAAQRVLDTGRLVVSDIVIGKVSKRRVFDVQVPISAKGQIRYILIVTDEPPRIARVLSEQAEREGWYSAVLDGKGSAIAIDNPIAAATGVFPMQLLKGSGRVETIIGGEQVLLHFVKSELTGWTSVVWVPLPTLDAPTGRLWRTLIAASLIALLASLILAYLFAQPFANLMRHTMRNVSLMGSSNELPPIKSMLTEGSVISNSLHDVNRQLRARQRENEESRALLLALLDTVPEGITIVGGLDMKVVANSRQAVEWQGHDPSEPPINAGEVANELSIRNLDGSVPAATQMPLYRASRLGERTSDLQVTLVRADGKTMPIEMSVNPFRDGAGKIIGAISSWRDITERRRREHNLRLITRELTHRAKNLLTVILGIAKQTARDDLSTEEFLSAFSRRIQGLGASHDLLIRSDWDGAQLEELINSQLAHFGGLDGVRIKAKGPSILLKNDVLQTLGLAFHELGTNAVKYGSLSVEGGSVEISWRIRTLEGVPRLKLTWRERGGPPVKKPARKGFGHNITVRSLARVVSGEVKIDFAKSGVVWSVDAPLSAIELEESGAA
jgi:two-component sensor histidine kinase/PAS domain-containing protein